MPSDPVLLPPDHLVDRPAPTGLRRLGVGTAPFNFVSFLVLVAISCFIVRTPRADHVKLDARAAAGLRDQARRAAPKAPAPAIAAPMQVVTLASAPGPATAVQQPPASGAAPTAAVSAPRPFVPTPRPKPKPQPPVAVPPVPKPVTCDSFGSQPDAQVAFDANRGGLAGLDGDSDGIACEHLPGRVTTPAAPKVPVLAALVRPYTRLYGVHTPNAPYRDSELAEFTTAAGGKAPNTVMFFQNFGQPYPADAIAKSWAGGSLPMVTLEPIVPDAKTGQPTLRDITTGKWDPYLKEWAAAAKAQGQPFALRFAQEMNGDWYPWSDGQLGNARGDFIKTWRHVHDVFAAAGATNVIWVWSVNRIDNLDDRTLARVYPGDVYVDWVGISGYYRSAVSGVRPSFDATFKATLAELKKVAPAKLVMLTEVGAGTTVENRVAWITSMFRGLLDHPEVIGFSWFNDFKDGGDWRIQYAQASADAFAAGVADLRYGSIVNQTEPAPTSPAVTMTAPPVTPSTTSSQPATTSTTAPATTSTTLNAVALGVLRKRGVRGARRRRQLRPSKYPVLRH